MKEKIKRILDLVRGGKLTLEDAGPLLAALSARLALTDSDRELVQALLNRGELDTAQIAEHLMLLRGLRDAAPSPPPPPRPPGFSSGWNSEGRRGRAGGSGGLDDLGSRIAERVERAAAEFAARAEELGGHMEDNVSSWVDEQLGGGARGGSRAAYSPAGASGRILRIEVESQHGDEYTANLPVSLAPHLHKLIPPHGLAALEQAGFSVEALQLILEAQPGPGPLIEAEDQHGNSVRLTLK